MKAQTSGIFRVPGSVRVVNALYDYYCVGIDGEDVSTTTHCPSLPSHLNCGVHDVASTFKRLLAGLPGGILGSLGLFDALVAIHSQLHNTVETNRTKESKLRARMIALAICTVRSQYQRDLICAVFGLLCLVGRTAENTPREDDYGRPMPTSDLMGYNALAIIFGPLLVGDLLGSYSMKLADPVSGLVILPITQPGSGKYRRLKGLRKEKSGIMAVDRIMVANDITEMLLVHWRDVVRNLASLKAHKKEEPKTNTMKTNGQLREILAQGDKPTFSRSAASPTGDLERGLSQRSRLHAPRRMSTPPAAHSTSYSGKLKGDQTSSVDYSSMDTGLGISEMHFGDVGQDDTLQLKRRRSRPPSSVAFRQISGGHPMSPLSPTMEEGPTLEQPESQLQRNQYESFEQSSNKPDCQNRHDSAINIIDQSLSGSHDSPNPPAQSDYGQPLPPTHQPIRHQVTKDDLEYTELKVDTRRIADNVLTESSMSLGSIRRRNPSSSGSETHSEKQYQSQVDDSTAGHTPLLRGHKSPIQESKSTRVVAFDDGSTRSTISPSPLGFHRSKGQENMEANSIQHSIRPSSCSPEPYSGRAKSPSYMPSLLNPSRTPPLYKAELLSAPEDSRTQYSNGQPTIPARDSTPTIRWKQLVRGSSPFSPEELKSKRMARGSRQSLAHESWEPRANEDLPDPLTPDWKRQLLMKRRSREQSEQDYAPPKRVNGNGKLPSEDLVVECSHSTKDNAPSLLDPQASASSSSQRSTSKPVSGTVKAIAARFDTGSEESTSSQNRRTLKGSRSFMSPNTDFENQDGTQNTASQSDSKNAINAPGVVLSNQGLKRTRSTPGRFRASISRLSQGLRSSPALAKHAEFPTPSKPSAIPEDEVSTFNNLHGENQAISSGVPQLQVQPMRPLSTDAIVLLRDGLPRREGLPRRRRSDMTLHSPETFEHDHPAENGTDDTSRGTRHMRRSNSGTSEIQRHQIRLLHSQLDVRNEHIHGLRKDLDAMYGTDVGVLSQQLRHTKRECQLWKDRALAAEKKLRVFERFSAKFKGLKGDVDEMSNSVGARSSTCSYSNLHRALSQSSCCSTHPERPGTSQTCHHHEKDRRSGGSDGVDDPEVYENYISKYLDDTQARTRQCTISKAQSELWVAAERLLGV
jgi:hypothetical protein